MADRTDDTDGFDDDSYSADTGSGFEFRGYSMPYYPGALPLGFLWGAGRSAGVTRMNKMADMAEKKLDRPINRKEATVLLSVADKSVRWDGIHGWFYGTVGSALTVRRAYRQGWTFRILRSFNSPSPTYTPGRISLFGFPERMLPPRGSLFVRMGAAFVFWGWFGTAFSWPLTMSLSLPADAKDREIFGKMFLSPEDVKKYEERQQMRLAQSQTQSQLPSQMQSPPESWKGREAVKEQSKSTESWQGEDSSEDYLSDLTSKPEATESRSKWAQLRAEAEKPRKEMPVVEKSSGETDRERAQREFDERLERERRGDFK